jgi:hypothetical protein
MQACGEESLESPAIPERRPNRVSARRNFWVNDLEYAPFGWSWLRGITPARLGLIELLLLIFSLRHDDYTGLEDPWSQLIEPAVLRTHLYLAASVPMLLLVNLAERRTTLAANTHRMAALSSAVVAGALAYAVVLTILYVAIDGDASGIPFQLIGAAPIESIAEPPFLWSVLPVLDFFLRALLMGGLLTGVLYLISREAAIAAAVQSTRLTCIALDKQMAEAELHVLQAQIEPHFLFNTLAHVKRLYLVEPAHGKTMLHNLQGYLRAALPRMRESDSTLGRELTLASAYLDVVQARMGERLKVKVAAPKELHPAHMPPMMLSTLVENAIKHGIAPLLEGGTVSITAVRESDRLKVSVADNGLGFQETSGSGVGLANIRARLDALYGPDGRLTFTANPVRGVTVSIELPFVVRSSQRLAA